MKKALADVLWEAANEHLSAESNYSASCCAAYRAERGDEWGYDGTPSWSSASRKSKAVQFLRALGCPVESSRAFYAHPIGESRQGVRYMWLLLAMHAAEDEKIMVEVSQ